MLTSCRQRKVNTHDITKSDMVPRLKQFEKFMDLAYIDAIHVCDKHKITQNLTSLRLFVDQRVHKHVPQPLCEIIRMSSKILRNVVIYRPGTWKFTVRFQVPGVHEGRRCKFRLSLLRALIQLGRYGSVMKVPVYRQM
jgi:hypothetical protein